jgi:hypothetical protein
MVDTKFWLVELMLLLLLLCSSTMGKIIYVDDDADGENNGSSWENAYIYLQDALADANTAEKPVEVRIGQGVYKPDHGAGVTRGDSRAEFQLINSVTILGGFAGVGATEPDARYIEAYETILSGDLSGNDVEVDNPDELHNEPTRAENSICIVSGGDGVWFTVPGKIGETAVLDGVTITAGYHCMRNLYGNPTVANCAFTNAHTGIFNIDNSQRLTGCTFKNLWFQAIHQSGNGFLTLTDCLFIGNEVGIWSGFLGNLTLQDCTFVGSRTMESWEAIYFWGENLRLYNCEFRNIVASGVAGVEALIDGEFIADNCAFIANVGRSIDHSGERMVITNCIFAGNRGRAIDSTSRYVIIENCTFSDNSTDRGSSALDTSRGSKVSNCIYWGNSHPAINDPEQEILIKYCNVQGGWSGEGNIDVDPCFAMPGYWDQNGTPDNTSDDFWVDGDYHLKSEAGRWDPESESWVIDDVTSPCIDAGDPFTPVMYEPHPRGCFINMGAYGGTAEASKSTFNCMYEMEVGRENREI